MLQSSHETEKMDLSRTVKLDTRLYYSCILDTIQYCSQSNESFLKSTKFYVGVVLELGKRSFGVVLRHWGVHCTYS